MKVESGIPEPKNTRVLAVTRGTTQILSKDGPSSPTAVCICGAIPFPYHGTKPYKTKLNVGKYASPMEALGLFYVSKSWMNHTCR